SRHFITRLFKLYPTRDYACANRLCQYDYIPHARTRVGCDFSGIDYAGYRIAKHDLLTVDTMTTNQRHTILVQRLQPAAHDIAENRGIDALLRKTGYCQS